MIFLIAAFVCISDESWAQLPAIRETGIRQGLPQSEISCLMEDKRGFLWAGTNGGGLARLNGSRLQVFSSSNGLAGDNISDLQSLEDGSLLVTARYAGLQVLSGKKAGPVLASEHIREYLRGIPLSDSLFFAVHPEGISLFHRKKGFRKRVGSFPFHPGRVHAASLLNKRWILLAMDSGFFCADVKKPVVASFLTRRKVSALKIMDRNSAVLVEAGGQATILEFKNDRPTLGRWHPMTAVKLQAGEEIRQVVFGLGQRVNWVTTSKNRLLSSVSGETDLSRLNGMRVPALSAMLCDRNSCLRIGTLGFGLLSIPESSALSYSCFPLLANGMLTSVMQTSGEQVLCGGMGTGLLVFSPEKKDVRCLFPGSDVSCLNEGPGFILCGTGNGFRVLNKIDFSETVFHRTGAKTTAFHNMGDGRILIGTAGAGLWIWQPGKKPVPCFPAQSDWRFVYSLLQGPSGSMLLASNTGVWKYRIQSGILEKMYIPDSLNGPCFSGTRDIYGNYWFSTSYGLLSLAGRNWASIRTKSGLSSPLIYTLNADSAGNIWVGGNKGLDKITLSSSGKPLKIKNYGPEEGFDGYEANTRASWLTASRLFICTIQGLFSMPLNNDVAEPVPAKPEISLLLAGNQNRPDTLIRDLPFSVKNSLPVIRIQEDPDMFIVEISSINALHPSKITFSYRIPERDSAWSAPSSAFRIRMRPPSPGDYTLELKACYSGGNCSEITKIKFRIEAHWLQPWMPAFAALLMLFILALNSGLFKKISRFRKNTDTRVYPGKENPREQIFLLPALFYPLLTMLAVLIFDSIHQNVLVQGGLSLLCLVVLLASFFPEKFRIRPLVLRKALFFAMVLDSCTGIYLSGLHPFYAAVLLGVTAYSIFAFTSIGPVFLLAAGLNAYAFCLHLLLPHPAVSPVLFQLACTVLSLALILIFRARKRNETKQLLASLVLNSGPLLILAVHENGNIAFMSENFIRLSGFHPGENSSLKEWSCILQNPGDLQKIDMLLNHFDSEEVHLRVKVTGSEICTLAFRALPGPSGLRILLAEDIHQRAQMGKRNNLLVQNPDDFLLELDTDEKIRQAFLVPGFLPRELKGICFSDLIMEEYREMARAFFRHQAEQKNPFAEQEFPLNSETGEIRWFSLRSSLNPAGLSPEPGFFVAGRDFTRQKAAEESMNKLQETISDSYALTTQMREAAEADSPGMGVLFSDFAIWKEPESGIGGNILFTAFKGHQPVLAMGNCPGTGLKAAFQSTLATGILRELFREDSAQPEIILGRFNRRMGRSRGEDRGNEEQNAEFPQLALLWLDVQKGELCFISSGIRLIRIRNGIPMEFPPAGAGQKLRPDYSATEQRIPLEPEDVFFLFTNGFSRAKENLKADELSDEQFKDILLNSGPMPLLAGMQKIQAAIQKSQNENLSPVDRMMVSFRI